LEGIVSRTIVNENELELQVLAAGGQGLESPQELGQASGIVVNRHDDGNERHDQATASAGTSSFKWLSTCERMSVSIGRTTRAGTPATTVQAGTFLVTIACGATMAPRPISTPAAILAPVPITASARMVGPCTEKGNRPKRFR